MELINYPTPCRERRAANNGDTDVAAISVVRNERGRSLSREDQGGRRQVPDGSAWDSVAIALTIAFATATVVSCSTAGCCIDASASHPLDSASARPIEAPLPLVHWCLSSCLPLIRRLVVALPVVACLRLASHFVGQPPHTSILDPSSLFTPAGCRVTSLRTASASRRAGPFSSSLLLYLIVACEWCIQRMGLDCRQCRHCHPIPPEIPVGSGHRSGVAPPPAPAKHVARLVHWGQHQQRTAAVTPSVIIVDVRVELVPHRIAFPSLPSLECCPFVPVSVNHRRSTSSRRATPSPMSYC